MKRSKYEKREHIYPEKINGYLYYKVKYKDYLTKRFKNKEDAKLYLANLILSDANANKNSNNTLTFNQGVEALLFFLKSERKSSTYNKKRQMFEDYILKHFPDKPISEIDMSDCTLLRVYLGSLNCSTIYKNELLRLFKQVFNFVDRHYDVENKYPRRLEKFALTDDEKLAEVEKVEEVWSPDEFGKFINCVTSLKFKIFFIVSIAAWTRLGETLGVQWRDYDGKSIHIYKSIMKVKKAVDPKAFKVTFVKTKHGDRVISLPKEMCEMLDQLKERQMKIPNYNESWYVFNRYDGVKYLDGTMPIARTNINREFKKRIKESGVKEIRIHDLRHSGATYAILNGEDIKAVSERLGHSDIEITLRVYHHAIGKAKNKIMERMNDFAKFSK